MQSFGGNLWEKAINAKRRNKWNESSKNKIILWKSSKRVEDEKRFDEKQKERIVKISETKDHSRITKKSSIILEIIEENK